MPRRNRSKDVGWGREESRIVSAIESPTHVQSVTFDEADGEDSQIKDGSSHGCISRKRVVWVLLFVVVLTIVVTPLAIFLPEKPFNIDQFAENEIPSYSREAARRNTTSPQAKALKLIQDTASSSSLPKQRLRQRYALAVLYYSAVALSDSAGILEQENECDWFKLPDAVSLQASWDGNQSICDEDKQYLMLVLGGGLVKGTVPAELEMLTRLRYLKLGVSGSVGTLPPQL
jgi:hypothetical protein